MKYISIFCGAHEGKNPKYAEAAKSLSECVAKKGINVVFGGGNVGLMKIISDKKTKLIIHSELLIRNT